MEHCDICGRKVSEYWESGEHKVCQSCKLNLHDYIGHKCLSCGAWGFIPINKKNVDKILYFLPLSETQVRNGDMVVVWEKCPNCGGIEHCKMAIAKCLKS